MPQQVSRLVILFVLLVGGLLVARQILVPETFGELGHYRAAAVDSAKVLPVRYAGQQVCGECHDEIAEVKQVSRHRGVACEACHGPAASHVEAPDEVTPRVPRKRGYCPLCHGYNASRPTGFPQIDPTTHNPVKPCISCHDPHEPLTPHTPEACSACHGEIARTKAVSHHATLDCIRCHKADERHKQEPRSWLPSKPEYRSFCGECHARGADAPREIPRIDLATHGGDYVCWQCHYPHHPEVD